MVYKAPQPLGGEEKGGKGVGDSKRLDLLEEDNSPEENNVEGGDSETGDSALPTLDPSGVIAM